MTPAAAFRAEAVVAGTLCLMSCFATARRPMHAERIADNLALLAADAALTAEFRSLCRRLAERWDALAGDLHAEGPAPGAGTVVAGRGTVPLPQSAYAASPATSRVRAGRLDS